eukprot:319361-Hanusia_phi.AAC.3
MASIHTTPSCLRLVDVTGNGDPKLIVADQNQKLRVYKGINLISELALLDTPSAICPFYADQKSGGERIPSIAVACGQQASLSSSTRSCDQTSNSLFLLPKSAKKSSMFG